MSTIRLTMAQAVVRFLAAQKTEVEGQVLPLFGGVWAIFGHGNVAGMGEALHGARETPADLPLPQRAGDGARGHRLRQGLAPPPHDGLHDLDRPRRHQHGDGGGGRPCQPLAGASPARRRLRQSPPRPGAAAGREFLGRNGLRQRLLPPGLALFRPHRAARADRPGAAARHDGPHRSRRMRPGDLGALPGHAGRGLRLSGRASLPSGYGCPAASVPTRESSRRRSHCCGMRQKARSSSRAAACFIPKPSGSLPISRAATAFLWRRLRPASRAFPTTIPR